MKKIAYDTLKLDQLKIVEDSKCCLKVNAVITKVGVYKYEDGMAFKSKMDLLKAAKALRFSGATLTLHNHPDSKVIMSTKQVHGGVEKPFFDRDKIRAVLNFDKSAVPAHLIQKVRDAVINKTGLDNSIGFYYEHNPTPGTAPHVNTGKPTRYDYAMNDIFINHVAVMFDGEAHGRCHFPNCGVGADTKSCMTCPRKARTFPHIIGVDMVMRRIALDPFAGYKNHADCVAKNRDNPDIGDVDAYCADIKRKVEGAKERYKSRVQNYGGKRMSTKTDYGHAKSPEETEAEFKECVAQRTQEGMTLGEAEAHCQAGTKPADEPVPGGTLDQEDRSPYQICVTENLTAGMTPAEAAAKCKETGVVKQDQDAAFENCVARKKEEGKTQEEAESECRAEHPIAEEAQEPAPTPMEQCVKDRMETSEETEEEAKTWCEAELAGEHTPAQDMIDNSQKLIKLKQQDTIEKQRRARRNPV